MYDKCYFCLDQLPKLKKESTASFFRKFWEEPGYKRTDLHYCMWKKESGKRGKRKKNGKRNAVSAQALADTHWGGHLTCLLASPAHCASRAHFVLIKEIEWQWLSLSWTMLYILGHIGHQWIEKLPWFSVGHLIQTAAVSAREKWTQVKNIEKLWLILW